MQLHEVEGLLDGISDLLKVPLISVLQQFKPDEYMAGELAKYLPEWGSRTLHGFMVGVIIPGETDILNGKMEHLHIFAVLDILYRSLKE